MRKRVRIVSIFSILLIITVIASTYIGEPVTSEEQAVEIANRFLEKEGYDIEKLQQENLLYVHLDSTGNDWCVSYIPPERLEIKIFGAVPGSNNFVIVIKKNNSKNVKKLFIK